MQEYQIFINEFPIVLTDLKSLKNIDRRTGITEYRSTYDLESAIDCAVENCGKKSIYIYSKDVNKLKNDFFSLFKMIIAGGGIVTNNYNDILWIYRRGKWDLPKGKINKKENIEEGALREVREETGIEHVKIVKELTSTYHVYWLKGKRILKRTHWYHMAGDKKDTLMPEEKESIEKVVWVAKNDLDPYLEKTYETIRIAIGKMVGSHF